MNAPDRYHRQTLLPQIGPDGRDALGNAQVCIIGCGALGTAVSEILARAGVGTIHIVDRDFVEQSNLQRQILFDEEDAEARLPKAVAAQQKLSKVNRDIQIDAHVVDVTPRNIEQLIHGADVIIDGTDNAETRFLINDACIKQGRPWVYGGAVGMTGMAAPFSPNGPCLRCFMPDPPPPGVLPTCHTQGVLSTVPLTVAALQATEAIKLILGQTDQFGILTRFDMWTRSFKETHIKKSSACPACAGHHYAFLETEETSWTTRLCGRCAVQISPATPTPLDLKKLCEKVQVTYPAKFNGLLLTINMERHEIIIFPDGRSIVKGTMEEAEARGMVNRILT